MTITFKQAARRYNYEWIFRNISCTFESNKSYAILGPNGSGKSTLLQTIAGSLSLSEGTIEYEREQQKIPNDQVFNHISWCAPYLDLPDEFTLREAIRFQIKFKPLISGLTEEEVIEMTGLKKDIHKQIRFFSSGMKQRVKLLLAITANTPILLLDEPATNLDEAGLNWYLNLVERFTDNRIVLVGSNQIREYEFCDERVNMMEYK